MLNQSKPRDSRLNVSLFSIKIYTVTIGPTLFEIDSSPKCIIPYVQCAENLLLQQRTRLDPTRGSTRPADTWDDTVAQSTFL